MIPADLIGRLESATEGSRALDRSIGEATGAEMGWSGDAVGLGYPRFSTSLDAALTLVPEGWFFKLSSSPYTRKLCATLYGRDMPRVWIEAATSALALCIASLRARSGAHHG